MSSLGGAGVGDQEQEAQGDDSTQTGTDESAADIVIQFRIPGTQRVKIPLDELHSVIDHAHHTEQGTPFSTPDTEADQLVSTPANVAEGGHHTQSSASATDQPTAVPKIATLVLRPPAGSVRQQTHRPVATIRPQTVYNLSDIDGQGTPTRGPIPPPRQVSVPSAQSAFARIPISVHVGKGSSMTVTLRQEDGESMDQTRQIHPQIPSGNPPGPPVREVTRPVQLLATSCGSSVSQQAEASVLEDHMYSPLPVGSPGPMGTAARGQLPEVSQPPVPPEDYASLSTAANTQEPVAALQTTYGARMYTPHSNPPTTNESTLEDVPETSAPEQHQQESYAVQHDVVPPRQDDKTSKSGAKISTAQPSTDFSGEDETHANICILYEGVEEEPNLKEEPETRLRVQVSPAHTSCQMPHASSSPSADLHVAQASNAVQPKSNAADLHQANHPICSSSLPQQLKRVENAVSTYDFTKLAVIFMQDKSTQVNIELDQQGDSPSKTEVENIATSSQMPSTVGDIPEMMQTESNFSLNDQSYTEAQDIITQFVLDPNLQCLLTPGSIQCPGGVPTDDTGMQQSEVAGASADTCGQDHPSGGSPLPRGMQDSLWPIVKLGMAQSCAGGGTGPTAVSHQHLTTAAPQGGQKRHFDPNEVDSPTAKKQAVVQLGTEFQCVPLSTTYLPQQKDSKPPNVVQETFIDTVEAGDLSQTEEHVLTRPYETTLACDSPKCTGRVVDIQSLNKENENEITANCTQEMVLAESVSVIQNIHCEHQRDGQGSNNAVELESHNATKEYPDGIMPIFQQLNAESSGYKKAKNYVTLDSGGYNPNETSCETPIIGKFSIGIGPEGITEENGGSIPNETSWEAPKIGKLSIGIGPEGITEENGGSIHIETSCEAPKIGKLSIGISQEGITEENGGSLPNETSFEAPKIGKLSIGIGQEGITEENGGSIHIETSCEAPKIGKLSSVIGQEGITEENGGSIPNESYCKAPIIGKLLIGIGQEGITEENGGSIHIETSCKAPKIGKLLIGISQEGITEENSGSLPNETSFEAPIIGKSSIGIGQEGITEENGGYIPNETSREAPIIGNMSIGIGQVRINEENGLVHVLFQQWVGDYECDEESGNLHEERGNECEPVGREDNSSSEVVTRHSQERNMDSNIDCNVTIENETVHDNVTSTVEVLSTTEHKETN